MGEILTGKSKTDTKLLSWLWSTTFSVAPTLQLESLMSLALINTGWVS